MTDELQQKVDDLKVEGWELKSLEGERAIMLRRKHGSLGAHTLIAILTVWWTFGLINVVYAAYKYFVDADKKVVRVE